VAFFASSLAGNKKVQGPYSITGIPRITGTHLFKLTTLSGAVVATAAGVTPGATLKKVKILIEGVEFGLLAANTWS
jgi:hypothetical protein